MPRDSYRSPWRGVSLAVAILALVAIIAAGGIAIMRQDSSSPVPSPTPSSTLAQPTATPTTNTIVDAQLIDAIYAFTEAYNLPASEKRNERLKQLSTPAGYQMVYRDPRSASRADAAAGDISIVAVRDSSRIQIEPFVDDPAVVSVSAEISVRIIRGGTIIQSLRLPGQITSWIKQDGVWKFAFLQDQG